MRDALRKLLFDQLKTVILSPAKVWLEDRPQRSSAEYVVFVVQFANATDGDAPVKEIVVDVTAVAPTSAGAVALIEAARGGLEGWSGAATEATILTLSATTSDSDFDKDSNHWWATLRLQGLAVGS